MKPFIKTTLAATLGVILASIIGSILGIILLVGIASSTEKKPSIEENSILTLNLNGSLMEHGSEDPFASFSAVFNGGDDNSSLGLDEILKAIKHAKSNDNIKGIYLKTGLLQAGVASFEEIRLALEDFKESGKFVYAYIEQTCEQGAYYISSVADSIFMNPSGSLGLYGMSATPVFYTDVLKKIGVEPQIFKVGTYKSAVEPYLNTKMSEASKEQTVSYMNCIWNNLLDDMSASRGMSKKDLNKAIDEFPMMQTAERVIEMGLIDSLCYIPDMKEVLAKRSGVESKDMHYVSVRELNKIPVEGEKYQANKIAVLYTAGQIYDKSNGMGSGEEIVYTPVVKELEKLRKDEHVKAVVLRVNSPGGSAYASEQICQAIKELKKVKPVIASMGDYAASGGYYISSNADSIIASPTTITGSIGIFGMFFNAEKLAQKVGLHYDMVKTNRFSDFGNMMRSMTPGEKALMQANIERGYELFVSRCAVGRGMTPEAIKKVAEGRVWTGEQALGLGLVDKLGYIDDAIEVAANMAGISEYSVVSYPEKKDPFTSLMEELSGGAQSMMQNRSMEARFENMLQDLQRSCGAQALMPYTLDIH